MLLRQSLMYAVLHWEFLLSVLCAGVHCLRSMPTSAAADVGGVILVVIEIHVPKNADDLNFTR